MMHSIQIIPIRSHKIIEKEDNLVNVLIESMKKKKLKFEDDDVLVIASKVISVVERRIKNYSEIITSELAEKLSKKAKMDPEFAQVIIEESDSNYIGLVPGAITTLNEYGLLANAGADQSNIGTNSVILLPEDCNLSANKIHNRIKDKTETYVGVIIADSRTMPLRLGTVGTALGTSGFVSVLDERGQNDLFGRQMHITTRAIADQLATAAELVMGETNEQTPFVIIRGFPLKRIKENEEKNINSLISAENCMFIGPLLPCLKDKRGTET